MSESFINGNEPLEDYLLTKIPQAQKVKRADLPDDKNGIDYWVKLQSGRVVGVDVKVRDEDWSQRGRDDVALETWSVVDKAIGWTRNAAKRTDYILFLWKETMRCMLMPFPMLCSIFVANWEQWREKYKPHIQRTKNEDGTFWESECVFVPRQLLWNKIYADFGGVPL